MLSVSGWPSAVASTFLVAILARVFVKPAAGSPSVQPLHLCFMVRIPSGKNTWGSRSLLSLLDLEGNLNSYPRFNCNPGLAKRMVISAEGGSLEGKPQNFLVAVEVGEGQRNHSLANTSQNFLKLFCCHSSDKKKQKNPYVFLK